ncbi:HxlR family transcriptional regulator [Nocardioides flavus (ex Wang et al. 2016)]|uniref:HxlR family transcriptional regulator n=1 Tax=Nocardioides flavus (ex Wang et al. 2016) TaxID=2058780 RepID=A0ABQ3HI73_9ACTN|nr:helix-turn-helix domain-containing protein [Nocardioides flavus (ex Wang et al. 2016)]GHE16441.1 HxlR family transcriptional regulator [Nocardioides flavus (ex Wang et al. 2016)]
MPTYGQFCPVARTAELVCERWMPLVLRELMLGSTRFSEMQRGVPLISPALLSKRLHQLVAAGVVTAHGEGRSRTYEMTPAGWELYPVIEAMGVWGQRWARSEYGADELDPSLLMWDMRRMLQPHGLAERRTVIEFWIRGGPPRKSTYWLVVDGAIDLCLVDPGQQVDLRVNADLRALTQVWMGDRTMVEAREAGLIEVLGPPRLAERFPTWLGHHPVLGGVARADAG